MIQWVTNHLGLKLLALALAVTLWFYVQGELHRAEVGSTVEREVLGLMAVPIRPRIVGQPASDHHVREDQIQVTPSSLLVAGRPQWLGHIHGLWTEPVDVHGARQTVTRQVRVGLVGSATYVGATDLTATVTVPIERSARGATP